MHILAATNNAHKLGEFRGILEPLGFQVVAPAEAGGIPETEETGSSFEENALLKAKAAAEHAKMPAFADDSGLEVFALAGAPGIRSARYAPTNDERIAKVLAELSAACAAAPENDAFKTSVLKLRIADFKSAGLNLKPSYSKPSPRSARFVCVIAFADGAGGKIPVFRGEVYGEIIHEPRGSFGFGYDPIFVPDGFDRTFAELGPEVKDKISHRARALAEFVKFLKLNRRGLI